MSKLNVAPTKSSLLMLKTQLAFAEEGFDLLEQKRQILLFELMSRTKQLRDQEERVSNRLAKAYEVLREAILDCGSRAIDQACIGIKATPKIALSFDRLVGIRLPRLALEVDPTPELLGSCGTSIRVDAARDQFLALIPELINLAELDTAVKRLAAELQKTQRRCNALSKIFVPNFKDTIQYVLMALEERERESFLVLKRIRGQR